MSSTDDYIVGVFKNGENIGSWASNIPLPRIGETICLDGKVYLVLNVVHKKRRYGSHRTEIVVEGEANG